MDLFRITILTPLPEGNRLSWIDLNSEITALTWTTAAGGYGVLKVGFRTLGMPKITGALHNPIEVPDLATVQVWMPSESGFLCYEGRVQEVDDIAGLRVSKFSASGFGTSEGAPGDVWFYVPPAEKGTRNIDDVERSASNLLYRMVSTVTDILHMGDRTQVVDPGGSYAPRQQAGRYLGQTIDQIQKAGAGGADVMYAVYEDRRIQLKPIEPPLDDDGHFAPDYIVSPDTRVTWKRSGSKLVGAVACEYTPPGGAKQSTPVRVVDGWSDQYGGLYRGMLIPTSAITLPQATLIRDRWLRRYSVPVITGTIVINKMDRPLEGRSGQPVQFYMYRYGEWIQYGDQPFFITQTQIDASSEKATITFVNVPLELNGNG